MTEDELQEALEFNPCLRFGLRDYDPAVAYVTVISWCSAESPVDHTIEDSCDACGYTPNDDDPPSGPSLRIRVHKHAGNSEIRSVRLGAIVTMSELRAKVKLFEERQAAEAEYRREAEDLARRRQALERRWVGGPDSQAARAARGLAVRPTIFWKVGDCTFETPDAAYRHLARHALSQALPARRLPKSWPVLPKGSVQKIARLIRWRDESFGLGKAAKHA